MQQRYQVRLLYLILFAKVDLLLAEDMPCTTDTVVITLEEVAQDLHQVMSRPTLHWGA